MTKVVYNACFGGFRISREAVLRGREISGDPTWGESEWDLSRTDPVLIQVVEELGKVANSRYSELVIRDLEPGTRYRIDEYDGNESVVTVDEYDWETA